MPNYHIDQTDQKILAFLVKNARMPFLEIARECGVSGAAIHQRIKKLEDSGVITGSRLLVKPQALGLNVCAFISVALSEAKKYPEVVDAFRKMPEIVECHFVTGKYSMLLKVYCFGHDHLMEILVNTIQRIPYVQSTDTQISLDQAIERQVWVNEYESTSYTSSASKGKKSKRPDIVSE
ncbi:MAG: Lrp/AsnC ligand binding domain-containing protein [Bacteroidales bacterium]|nr:Lrp/AsnC ligand binding domain-containing protein [Bacteroidales bacterium]